MSKTNWLMYLGEVSVGHPHRLTDEEVDYIIGAADTTATRVELEAEFRERADMVRRGELEYTPKMVVVVYWVGPPGKVLEIQLIFNGG